MNPTWFSEIESTIFTTLQYILTEMPNAPFPELNCTTSNQNETLEGVDDFPALYIHMLPPTEMGNDLENETINAIRATIELQAYSDKSADEIRQIMNASIIEMKKLRFTVSMFPDPQTMNNKHFGLARFTRVIGCGDTDIVAVETNE